MCYYPLGKSEIRLFILSPGSGADTISGHIEHKSLSYRTDTQYEALSYVWGDTKDPVPITVDDCVVSVTKSLEAALRHLRHPCKSRTLWVDYICINQKDTDERNKQVAEMGLIYERADYVVIWLGLETPDSRMGLEILRYFATEKQPHSHPIWQKYPQALVYRGLQDIMTRPWFERMWVVQEIGRSGHAVLLCGRDYVEWQSNDCLVVRRFMRMIKYAEILPQWKDLGLSTVNMQPLLEMLDFQDANQFSKPWGSCDRAAPDLLDLAYNMRHKQCTDPRDKVFGLWGLVGHLDHLEDFEIDYNLTVTEVYERVVRVSFPKDIGLNLRHFQPHPPWNMAK